ncbi:MAG: M20 family metallopeptidase [Verrucomicrobiaceae bacterium]
MADFLADYLKPLGYQCELEEIESGRPNLIARAPGSDSRPRILLGPHLDTVSITGMTIDPFAAEIREGKIWGRGASDTKGPMAAMLWGIKQNAHRLADMDIGIDFVGFMGEESSQPGSRHFAKNHASDYEFAIIGEPTSLEAVYCTKGCLWATLESKGQATHASQPHLGENAILALTGTLHRLMQEFAPRLAEFTHPILGGGTVNIGTIQGGSRTNIVPDSASATLDFRTVPEMLVEKTATQHLADFLEGSGVTLADASEFPPMDMVPNHPWLQRLATIHPQLKLSGAPWFSDAAHLSAAGLPSICIGPGSIDQAHTADEFISIADLEAGADWFTRLLADL